MNNNNNNNNNINNFLQEVWYLQNLKKNTKQACVFRKKFT